VCDLETSRMGAPYIYDVSRLRVNTASGIVTLSKWPSGAPDGHLPRVTIPDAVLIQFDLLRMSKILLKTCTC